MSALHSLLAAGLAQLTLVAAPAALASPPAGTHFNGTLATESSMLHTELRSTPAHVEAGRPVILALRVVNSRGEQITALPPTHEKPMHLFLISEDLQSFAHVHPEPQKNGEFSVEHTFEAGGNYMVFVDYARGPGHAPVERHSLWVDGPPRAPAALTETPDTQRADGLSLTLHGAESVRAGAAAHLHFDVTDSATGRPVEDLEPYLGAMAHFVVLSADGKDFLHVHPLDTPRGQGIAAHAVFPRPGLYKLWVQLQRDGQVVTAPFVLRIHPADASTPGNHLDAQPVAH